MGTSQHDCSVVARMDQVFDTSEHPDLEENGFA